MSEIKQKLRERLSYLSDDTLFHLIEDKPGEYTPEAMAVINEEVAKRGGLEDLKKRIKQSLDQKNSALGQNPPSGENLAFLKRYYPILVIAAYSAFMYVLDLSAWFYWLCLFGLIAWLFAVLFRPRFNPEDEIKELLSKATDDTGSSPPVPESGSEQVL